MSNRAATLKKSAAPPATKRPPSRAAQAAAAERLASEQFWAAYRAWHQTADSIRKQRAYNWRVCRRIAAEFQPEQIILFGSYADGRPTLESDVDLLVVMPFAGGQFHQAHKITQRLNLALPLDLLVYTPERWQYRLEIGDRFIREIIEQGKVRYEAPHA